MNRCRKIFQILLALITAMQLGACSKTARWEEEVPLNTGETIWVKRHTTYSVGGDAGNPLDLAYRPDWKETLVFEYKGKTFEYTGEAHLLVLAISPAGQPVLVAPAADKSWDRQNNYFCTTPHYVQLVPDPSGKAWSWPDHIESWLYGLPANLMLKRQKPSEMKDRYTTSDRNKADEIARIQSQDYRSIDAAYKSTACKRKN